MGDEYIELQCSACETPPRLRRDGTGVGFVCDCPEHVQTPQLTTQSLLDPHSGLWLPGDDESVVCQRCGSQATLHRLPSDGYYARCGCPNRALSTGAIGDRPLFDPFNGDWADIDL